MVRLSLVELLIDFPPPIPESIVKFSLKSVGNVKRARHDENSSTSGLLLDKKVKMIFIEYTKRFPAVIHNIQLDLMRRSSHYDGHIHECRKEVDELGFERE